MNKIFTLALFAMLALTSNATTRKWDFTKWSQTTIDNLMLGAGQVSPSNNWSDIEKSTATAPTETSANNCFWQVAVQTAGTTLQANGQDIAETAGLLFTNTSARSLAIAVNYPTALSDYHGPSYLWLGSKNINYFTIPNVKAGATIKIGIESHKASEARGVQLFVGSNSGTQLKAPDGSDVATPTVYEDQAWIVPDEGLTDTPNEDGTYNIVVRNTNGCHLYYITVEEGGDAEADKNVAWVSGDYDTDMAFVMKPINGIAYTQLKAADQITADDLRSYDAVVISNNVAADSPMGKMLADNIAYVPIVNLNADLFGYIPASTVNTTLTAVDKTNELFTSVELTENGEFTYAAVGYALPEKFAADDILARNGDAVAFHQHKANRNSYIFIPTNDAVDYNGAWNSLMTNAISMVAATKKTVSAAATPVISLAYANGQTTATITCSTSGSAIQYAIGDGAYQTYTEPIVFTEGATLKAKATAEGYTESAEATQTVDIQTQANAPTISVAYADGKATVTLTADEGATIYYNFTQSDQTAQSAQYTEPFEISENCVVTALVTAEGKLTSPTASQTVDIPGYKPMKKVLGHFDANKTEWSNGESKTYYYCYAYGDGTKKKYNLSENYTCTYAPEGNEWTLRTSGQQVVWESTSPQKNICDVSNYNPVRAIDVIDDEITAGEVTVGGVATYTGVASDGVTDSTYNDAPSFELQSNVKYQAPFDIVSYIGCKPAKSGFEYFVSADGENWTSLGNAPAGPDYTDAASKWRLWHRDIISYTGTDAVYLKLKSISTDSYRIFDIFVKGEGESDAIKEVATDATQNISVRKYVSGGRVLIQTANGTFTVAGARIK